MRKILRTLSGDSLNFLGFMKDGRTQERFACFEDTQTLSDRWLYESDIIHAVARTYENALQVDFQDPLKAIFDLSRFDEEPEVPQGCAFSLKQLQGLFNQMHGGHDLSAMIDEHTTLENIGMQ